jgi:hypothetical protein
MNLFTLITGWMKTNVDYVIVKYLLMQIIRNYQI